MDFIGNITSKKNTLTKNELKACERILEDLTKIQRFSLVQMAAEINISKTTILRFCQKLGYSGYTEFRYDCIKYVNTLHNREELEKEENGKMISVENNYIEAIKQMHQTIDEKRLQRLATLIQQARTIRCVGEINSAVICMQLRYALSMYGYDVDVLTSPAEIIAIDLAAKPEDLIFVISASAGKNSLVVEEAVKLADNCGCQLALVTMNETSSYSKKISPTILLPNTSTVKGNSLLENVPIFTIFVEILLNYLN